MTSGVNDNHTTRATCSIISLTLGIPPNPSLLLQVLKRLHPTTLKEDALASPSTLTSHYYHHPTYPPLKRDTLPVSAMPLTKLLSLSNVPQVNADLQREPFCCLLSCKKNHSSRNRNNGSFQVQTDRKNTKPCLRQSWKVVKDSLVLSKQRITLSLKSTFARE